jgi:hypothetical protein
MSARKQLAGFWRSVRRTFVTPNPMAARPSREITSRDARGRPVAEAQPGGAGQTILQPKSPTARTEITPLHLGIDFGTRFTKVCFRDRGRDRTTLVTFTTKAPQIDQALIRSHLELHDGRVVTGLTHAEWANRRRPVGAIDLDFPKIRLAQLDMPSVAGSWSPPQVHGCTSAKVIEALCTFYLASVIERACGWVAKVHAPLLVRRTAQWSFSIGIPARYGNSPALARFQRVLGQATVWAHSGVPEAPTVDEICTLVSRLESQPSRTDVSVQAENAAAIRSFITSPHALEGVYLYFDVGAGTLDGASFRFYRPPDEAPVISIYSSEVEPLGTSAVAGSVAARLGVSREHIEELLKKRDARYEYDGALLKSWRDIQTHVTRVILSGRTADRDAWSAGLGELARALHRRNRRTAGGPVDIPLFLGGGGGLLGFYRYAVLETYEERRLADTGVRRYALEALPVPDELDMSGIAPAHYGRFAVAYGLSIHPDEGPSVHLEPPEPLPPKPRRGPSPIDYFDTKDLE